MTAGRTGAYCRRCWKPVGMDGLEAAGNIGVGEENTDEKRT